ncbi:MAG: DUF3006 domain-containing protein [Mobilitalea sp.]
MQKLIIDRFEGSYAICEKDDKSMISIPKYKLPLDCKEGECLVLDSEGMYQKDTEATPNREKRIFEKMNRLQE